MHNRYNIYNNNNAAVTIDFLYLHGGTHKHGLGLHSPHLDCLQVTQEDAQPVLKLLHGVESRQTADHCPGGPLPHIYRLHVQGFSVRVLSTKSQQIH